MNSLRNIGIRMALRVNHQEKANSQMEEVKIILRLSRQILIRLEIPIKLVALIRA